MTVQLEVGKIYLATQRERKFKSVCLCNYTEPFEGLTLKKVAVF